MDESNTNTIGKKGASAEETSIGIKETRRMSGNNSLSKIPSEQGTSSLSGSDMEELPTCSTSTPLNKKRFTVQKWDAVALWSWDIVVENCAICRNSLMELCIECQADPNIHSFEECTTAWGVCNHAFHFHCIARWLQTRPVCPLDNSEWAYLKYGK